MKISDFVVGLGFDTSDFDRGAKNVSSSLGGLRSDILQTGVALAGAFGIKALTFDFAKTNDELRQVAASLGITTDSLYGANEAAKAFGARDGEMTALLRTLTSMKTRFNELGELGAFEELAKLGVDIDRLTGAKDSVSAMLALSDELAKLSTAKRTEAAQVLGISSQTLDLLSQGSKSINDLSKAYQDARPHTDAMASASRNLVAQINELEQRIGGRADKISAPLVTALGNVIGKVNDLLEANQGLIDQGIDDFIKTVSDHMAILAPLTVAITGSGLAAMFASLAKTVPVVGGALGVVATALIPISRLAGAIAVVGTAMELWDWDSKKFKEMTGIDLPDWMFTPIDDLLEDREKTVANRKANAYEQMRNAGIAEKGTSVVSKTVDGKIVNNIYLDGKLIDTQVVENLNFALDDTVANSTTTEER